MKLRLIPLFLALALLVGCSSSPEDGVGQDVVVEDADTSAATEESTTQQTNAVEGYYDLTSVSDTMLIAQVYSLLCYPEDYEGATFRIEGTYTFYTYPETGTFYFIVVNDEAGCCSQGIALRFPDGIEAPEEFCNVMIEGVVYNDVYPDYTMVFLDVTSIEPIE